MHVDLDHKIFQIVGDNGLIAVAVLNRFDLLFVYVNKSRHCQPGTNVPGSIAKAAMPTSA